MSLIKSLKISWLTDKKIKELSFGEVKSSKTLDPNTLEPEIGGLFCPKIFGSSQNYQCVCKDSKYQKVKNQKCDNCGVLIAHKNIRRWRMGHISLTSPVTNTLIFHSILPYLSQLLEIPGKSLEKLVYFEAWLVIDSGHSSALKVNQVLDRKVESNLISKVLTEIVEAGESKNKLTTIQQAQEMLEQISAKKKKDLQARLKEIKKIPKENLKENQRQKLLKEQKELEEELAESQLESIFVEDYLNFLEKHWKVKLITGSEALLKLLKGINLKKELEKVSDLVQKQNSETVNNRLRFIQACLKNEIPLEGLVLNHLPVIPAGLRPATKLNSNTIATASINSLYRKVIFTNEGLQKTLDINKSLKAQVLFLEIIHNRQRRLQEVVDQLIYSGESTKVNPTKSLFQALSGKEGIIRKYSLGKRLDYSARSVIVPNPHLKLNQVGLPIEMALTLYEPFLLAALIEKGHNQQEARELLLEKEKNSTIIKLLQEVIHDHPVLLNRAPTLHRLSIQGFQPTVVPGKSIQFHLLKTKPFNADFDGDQIAVHLPLTEKARKEVQKNVMGNYHLKDPKNGHLIDLPTQDMILGIYCLTKEKINHHSQKPIPLYYQLKQIFQSQKTGNLALDEPIIIPVLLYKEKFLVTDLDKFLITTLGKIKFNETLPFNFPYVNDLEDFNQNLSPIEHSSNLLEFSQLTNWKENWKEKSGWKKKDIIIFLNKLVNLVEVSEMAEFLDQLKELTLSTATDSGITISLFDLPELTEKAEIIQKSQKAIEQKQEYFQQGFYGKQEYFQQKLSTWVQCKNELEKAIIQELKEKKDSSLHQIWDSGARANNENLTQIFGMRGNMVDYQGKTIEIPIIASLREGLNSFEFFLSVYGAMKGMADTALKTAEAGYLTRRLVETVQSLVITKEDCQTTEGIYLTNLTEKSFFSEEENILLPWKERIYGRCLAEDLKFKEEKILSFNTLLTEKEIQIIQEKGISLVKVRSPFSCALKEGICQKCYGFDLSKNQQIVQMGEAVGIVASQSLGEPGTQLTMDTFHTGGVVGSGEDIVQGLPKVKRLLDNVSPTDEKQAILAKETGEISEIEINDSEAIIKQKSLDGQEITYCFKGERTIKVKKGQAVEKGEILTGGQINLNQLLSLTGRENCQAYIKEEVWKVYQDQGIKVDEKHLELFTRQMLGKVKITQAGDSKYLFGDIIDYREVKEVNQELVKKGKKPADSENILLGLKQVAKYYPSFLANISFQDTLKSLINFSLFEPIDYLRGPKESMIAGQLIPVGAGLEERIKREIKINKSHKF